MPSTASRVCATPQPASAMSWPTSGSRASSTRIGTASTGPRSPRGSGHSKRGRPTMSTAEQMQKMKIQPGFVAALDQSGGSTPHALALYGIKDHAWRDDDEMFNLVHQR